MVALNFLAFSLGFTLGGVLFEKGYQAGDEIGFYRLLFYIGAATGFLLLLLVPKLNKMLEGTDKSCPDAPMPSEPFRRHFSA